MLSTAVETDTATTELRRGATRLVKMPIAERRRLLRECLAGVQQHWQRWCELSWEAKRIPEGDPARSEDPMSAVVPTLRYLHLMDQTLSDLEHYGEPQLPGKPYELAGQLCVPTFPTHSLYDRLLFGPINAHVRLGAGAHEDALFGNNLQRASGKANDEPTVCLVLGAGNVSSIPITDTLTKIFQENQAVLLKMNPVNEYVGPVFEQAFDALIQADLLRVAYGGADVGAALIASPEVDCVHVTGSDRTHDAIVWGADPQEQAERKAANTPLLEKPITSELGNVSPWIIVPGEYTPQQLRFQAQHIVASVTTNASFVCIATKMLITSRDWPQREQFLALIEEYLAQVPQRYAYYPGAADRFARFTDVQPSDHDELPWTLRRNVDPEQLPHLFEEESFVCVFGETALEATSASEFLTLAVDFANERMWGTLSAAMTVPSEFQQAKSNEVNDAISRLRYGIVGINLWPGVAFALMSTPWGAYPGSTPQDIQSGAGSVHNTYLLDNAEQTVISAPIKYAPKPVWFATHKRPEFVGQALVELYLKPSIWRIPPVLFNALLG